MQFHKDDNRKRIIIFNNRYLSEDNSSSQTNKNSKFKMNINEKEEIELNLPLENDENIKLKLNIDENIVSNIDKFCKEYNLGTKDEKLILKQVYSKLAELKEEKRKNANNINLNSNNNINKSNNDSDINFNNSNGFEENKIKNNDIEKNKIELKNKKNQNNKLKRNKTEDIFNKLYYEKDTPKEKAEKTQKFYTEKIYPFKPKKTIMAKNMKNDKYNDLKKKEEERKSIMNKTPDRKNYKNIINVEQTKNYFIQNNIENQKLRNKQSIKYNLNNTYEKENSKYSLSEESDKKNESDLKICEKKTFIKIPRNLNEEKKEKDIDFKNRNLTPSFRPINNYFKNKNNYNNYIENNLTNQQYFDFENSSLDNYFHYKKNINVNFNIIYLIDTTSSMKKYGEFIYLLQKINNYLMKKFINMKIGYVLYKDFENYKEYDPNKYIKIFLPSKLNIDIPKDLEFSGGNDYSEDWEILFIKFMN